MRRYDFKRGCLVGNLGKRWACFPKAIAHACVRCSRIGKPAQHDACVSAGGQGDLERIDCENVAAFFWIGWEGAVLRAKLDGGPAALRTFANGFFRWR